MRITAEHLGLWDAFVNVLPQPLSQADAERDRRGKAFIGMHCSDLFMFHVEQATSAKAAWDILIALNAASSSARKLLLRQKMVGFKMSAREGVLEYFTRASQLRSDLAAAEEPMSDNQVVHMILAGLHSHYGKATKVLQRPTKDLQRPTNRLVVWYKLYYKCGNPIFVAQFVVHLLHVYYKWQVCSSL